MDDGDDDDNDTGKSMQQNSSWGTPQAISEFPTLQIIRSS